MCTEDASCPTPQRIFLGSQGASSCPFSSFTENTPSIMRIDH